MGKHTVIPINCHRVALGVSRGDYDDASWPIRVMLHFHLLWCVHCKKFVKQIHIIGVSARLCSKHSLPQEKEDEILERMARRLGD